MIELLGYLGIDALNMTTNDWLGVFFAVAVSAGMAYAYVMVLHPSNKDKFESLRGMALDDENHINAGETK